MIRRHEKVQFPAYAGLECNMMPIVAGDPLPSEFAGYQKMVDQCGMPPEDVVYLTVTESVCFGEPQRRPGIHTDATRDLWWGGHPPHRWGGHEGEFLASTDGACRAWDSETTKVDGMGALLGDPWGAEIRLLPNVLYQMSDTTPHEALPSTGRRQFFRLVAKDIGGWWREHSTPSPLGVQPQAPILEGSKFRGM